MTLTNNYLPHGEPRAYVERDWCLDQPFLTLTDGLARKLLDELAAYYGGMSETRLLCKYLDDERVRVDRLIGIVANGRAGTSP